MIVAMARSSAQVQPMALTTQDESPPVGVATLTQASVAADPMLGQSDAAAYTTSATVFVPEGSDPDLPLHAP